VNRTALGRPNLVEHTRRTVTASGRLSALHSGQPRPPLDAPAFFPALPPCHDFREANEPKLAQRSLQVSAACQERKDILNSETQGEILFIDRFRDAFQAEVRPVAFQLL
jgi:hypothetical protein